MTDNQPDPNKERDIEEIKYDKEIRILQGVLQGSFVWAISPDPENKDPLTVQGVVSYNVFLMDEWSLYEFLGRTKMLTEGVLQGLLYKIWQDTTKPQTLNLESVDTAFNPDIQSRLRLKFGQTLFNEYNRLTTQKSNLEESRKAYEGYEDYAINEIISKIHPSWSFQIYRLGIISSALGYKPSDSDLETWFINITS